MKNKNKTNKFKGASWLTTDEEERELRRKRASDESFDVKYKDQSSICPFGIYNVSKKDDSLSRYIVEIRSITQDINTCSCPDFAINGLGTCKHIEKVKQTIKSKRGASQSPFTEVFMQRNPYRVKVIFGDKSSENTKLILAPYLKDSYLINDSLQTLKSFITLCKSEISSGNSDIRISFEVFQHLASLAEEEGMNAKQKAFAAKLDANDGQLHFLKQKLYPYQREGMMHLAFHGRAMLADEMGLGKTVQAIAAAILLREMVGISKVLVVVPTSLKSEWEEQIKIFTDASALTLFGNYGERLRIYRSNTTFFLITNYEQVLRDVTFINQTMKPDLVILDEAQRIKNWKTKTARKIKRLNSKYAFVLTGTPLENRIDELYSILDFVNPRLLGSIFRFNRKFYDFDDDKRIRGMQNLSELHELTKKVMLRRRKSEINEQLPEISKRNYFIELTEAQTSDYQIHYNYVCRLIKLSEKRPLTAAELDKLHQKLACMRMVCDSCYILDRETKVSPKIDELKLILSDIWQNDPDRKILIFSEWTRMLELVEEMLKKSGTIYAIHTGAIDQVHRRKELNNFKTNKDCKVLLSSESGGVGLNLQAASVVINLDLPWNPAKLEQRIARAWRKHQSRSVDVINIIAKGTIEHQMLGKLKYKQGLADLILDAKGDSDNFEQPNARKAFLAQLKDIIRTDAPVANEKPLRKEPKPSEKLSAVIKEKADDIITCNVKISGDDDLEKIEAVLAVSNNPDSESAEKCAQLAGVPKENVVTITSEIQDLLQKLEKLGFLTIAHDSLKKVDTGTPSMPTEEFLRRARIRPLLEYVDRKLKLASILNSNDFADEAANALHEATCKMIAAFYVMNGAKNDEPLEPITPQMLDAISSNGRFPQYIIDDLIKAYYNITSSTDTLSSLTSARAFFR